MKKKILRGILILFALLVVITQIIPPANVESPFDPKADLSSDATVPAGVVAALKTGCYDCHSNQPNFPWYAKIGIVNYYLTNHIGGGLKQLTFSEWSSYSEKEKTHLKQEICEQIEEGNMPLWNYALMHKDVVLSENQKKEICQWVNQE